MTINLSLEFSDGTTEQLTVAADTMADDLCNMISKRFAEGVAPDSWILLNEAEDMQLVGQQTLQAQQIGDGERIIVLQSRRKLLSMGASAVLREVEMGDIYPIEWQPALIGRPGHIRDRELLAADLEWLPNSLSISRNHALIHEQKGTFFIRHLAGERNQSRINDKKLQPNKDYELKHGDAITLGSKHITLSFLLE